MEHDNYYPVANNLNEQQQQAVLHRDGPVLIYAGAGSGKTMVMCHSIVNMLHTGVPSSAIFAVTFTNKAAKELRTRVENLVGAAARNMLVSTFHSACVRILRLFAHEIGFTKAFSIYDDSEQNKILKAILSELGSAASLLTPAILGNKIEKLKNAGITPADYLEKINSELSTLPSETLRKYGEIEQMHTIQKGYALYQERMLAQNAMDFGDLIMHTVSMLEKKNIVLQELQARYTHFLVDEFQDTNPIQFKLIELLSSHTKNLRVVGDDDQSIYSWRGAEPAFILNFEKHYPNAKVFKLEKNYRSTGAIIKAASAVIDNNRHRAPKTLWTDADFGELIGIKALANVHEEAEFIVNTILKNIDNGVPLSKMAILYRTNAQSRVLEDELRRRLIPYVIYGSVRFYERAEIKTILAYLKLLVNPNDDAAFIRAISAPKRGFGDKGISKLQEAADYKHLSLMRAAIGVERNELNIEVSRGMAGLKNFAKLFQLWFADLQNNELISNIFEKIISDIDFQTYIFTNYPDDFDERWLNIIELKNALIDFERDSLKKTEEPLYSPTTISNDILSEFLHQAMLVVEPTSFDVEKGSADAISMMTIHAAKGLEFEHLILSGLEEGTLPHLRSLDDPSAIEEERRLMYVAITRARKTLLITRSREDTYRHEYRVPSRFLSEIPDDCVNLLGIKPKPTPATQGIHYIREDF